MKKINHTFAVCAYGKSEYLEECILSLKNQSVSTKILVTTSTPNDYIKEICKKYSIPLYVNDGERGITQDWNFAYSKCDTSYITIAHQDDVYSKEYVERYLEKIQKSKKPLIIFSDYYEIRNGKKIKTNKLLIIKKIMLIPLRLSIFWSSRFVRRRILSFGTPICCPSVMFARENLPNEIFQHGFRADEDWEAWERLSKIKGEFIYITKALTYHRIHGESETTKILRNNARAKEDYIMFRKFWPPFIAKILTKLYGKSEKSNYIV